MLAIYARFQTENDFDFLEKSNFGICVLEFFILDPKTRRIFSKFPLNFLFEKFCGESRRRLFTKLYVYRVLQEIWCRFIRWAEIIRMINRVPKVVPNAEFFQN